MRVVKAAAVQLSPVLYSREGTVGKVVQKIHELGQQAVQFATFPETVVPYYPYFSFMQPAYQIVGGREHLKLLDEWLRSYKPEELFDTDGCLHDSIAAVAPRRLMPSRSAALARATDSSSVLPASRNAARRGTTSAIYAQ